MTERPNDPDAGPTSPAEGGETGPAQQSDVGGWSEATSTVDGAAPLTGVTEVIDASAAHDVVPAPPVGPARRRGRGLVAALVAAVVLIGAGVAYGVGRLSGGGAQPSSRVPASAIAIVSVDLDPSAEQKVDALRFARRFPELKSRIGSGDDLREVLVRMLADGPADYREWATDARTWMGERAAFAVLPGAEPTDDAAVLLVVAVRDEQKARASMDRHRADGPCRVADGFAVCAQDEATLAAAVAAADRRSLADEPTYRDDIEALGGRGLVHAWVDGSRAAGAIDQFASGLGAAGTALAPSLEGQVAGRLAAVLKFDGPHLEVEGRAVSTGVPALTGRTGVGDLPADTAAAVGLASADTVLTSLWGRIRTAAEAAGQEDQFDQQMSLLGAQAGVALPGDLVRAAGSSVTLAVSGADTPQVAVRLGGAPDAVASLLSAGQRLGMAPLASVPVDGGTVVSTDQGYANAVAGGSGLGTTDLFTTAVPDAKQAQAVVYVDLARIGSRLGALPGSTSTTGRASTEHLAAFGASVRQDGKAAVLRLRLVTR